MKRGKKEKSGKRIVKALALSQIFIFIISSFAFAFIMGGMIVSAADTAPTINVLKPGKTNEYVQVPQDVYNAAYQASGKDLTKTSILLGIWNSESGGSYTSNGNLDVTSKRSAILVAESPWAYTYPVSAWVTPKKYEPTSLGPWQQQISNYQAYYKDSYGKDISYRQAMIDLSTDKTKAADSAAWQLDKNINSLQKKYAAAGQTFDLKDPNVQQALGTDWNAGMGVSARAASQRVIQEVAQGNGVELSPDFKVDGVTGPKTYEAMAEAYSAIPGKDPITPEYAKTNSAQIMKDLRAEYTAQTGEAAPIVSKVDDKPGVDSSDYAYNIEKSTRAIEPQLGVTPAPEITTPAEPTTILDTSLAGHFAAQVPEQKLSLPPTGFEAATPTVDTPEAYGISLPPVDFSAGTQIETAAHQVAGTQYALGADSLVDSVSRQYLLDQGVAPEDITPKLVVDTSKQILANNVNAPLVPGTQVSTAGVTIPDTLTNQPTEDPSISTSMDSGFISQSPYVTPGMEDAIATPENQFAGSSASASAGVDSSKPLTPVTNPTGNYPQATLEMRDAVGKVMDSGKKWNDLSKEDQATLEKAGWDQTTFDSQMDLVIADKLANTPGEKRSYTNIFGKDSTYTTGTWGALGANLGEGLKWSLIIIGVVEGLGKTFLSEKNFAMLRAAEQAAVAGIMTYKSVYGLFETFGGKQAVGGKVVQGADTTHLGLTGGTWAMGIGILVAYLAFASQYKKEKQQEASIEFKCMPWQAPNGGSDCNKCNGNALQPCSEYRCKALGQTCVLINKGTGQDRCIDSSPSDVTSPGIKPDTTVLTQGYKYTDRQDRPPGGEGPAHVRITSATGGCLKAFTAFEFGIVTTDVGDLTQPAQCKLDYNHTANFDAMNYYMDDNNLFIENHSQAISLPGTDLLNKTFPGVKNDGEYTLYVRCKDGNGNENRDEYAVRFCIDKTPDLSSPIINSLSIPSGSPVLYGIDNLTVGVYTNEPANCRWSRKDASYSNMENQMSCSNNVWDMNAQLLYTCNARLTGIKDKEENNFYFRCTDLSNNTMQQSYNYKLIGTQPINILTVGPSGTIGSSTSTATVSLTAKTDNGYKNGESICYYSQTNLDKDYVAMFDTGTSVHKQDLDLIGGNYRYYFKCVDAGGNTAYNSTNFTVFVDKFAPAIVRAYLLESKLIVTTDEDSTCSYSTTSCNFNINEGVNMPIDSTMNHYADWKTEQTYYVKCKDKFNNEPDPTQCSMVIQPYSLVDLSA